MSDELYLTGAILMMAAVIGWGVWAVDDSDRRNADCEARNGVLVAARGHSVCISKDAVLREYL